MNTSLGKCILTKVREKHSYKVNYIAVVGTDELLELYLPNTSLKYLGSYFFNVYIEYYFIYVSIFNALVNLEDGGQMTGAE